MPANPSTAPLVSVTGHSVATSSSPGNAVAVSSTVDASAAIAPAAHKSWRRSCLTWLGDQLSVKSDAKVDVDPFQDLIPGYPKLAGLMEHMPEVAMFRRFGALNARNLLYYQNELVGLEMELKELEAEDAKSQVGKKPQYASNAFWLNTADHVRDGDQKQREVVLRIRCLLKEYSQYFGRLSGRRLTFTR
jgi:hypothetical protein